MEIQDQKIEQFLKEKNPTSKVKEITKLAGGSAQLTVLVEVEWEENGEIVDQGLVFKIHQESGALGEGSDQAVEFAIVKSLMDTEVKSPKAYWLERNYEGIGTFLVMEMVRGTASMSDVLASNKMSKDVGRQLVKEIAILHNVDLNVHDFSFLRQPKSVEDCALFEIEKYEELYRKAEMGTDPAFEEVLLWLKNNIPTEIERYSILWGDPGPGNFIHIDGEVKAVIDWEMAHIGDPMDEVGYLLSKFDTVAPLLTEEEFFKYYEQYSGLRINKKSVEYYRVMWNFRLAVIGANQRKDFATGKTTNVYNGFAGGLFMTIEIRKAFDRIRKLEKDGTW